MKYFASLLLVVCMALWSCSSDNEPSTETALPVEAAYLPGSVQFSLDDTDWVEKIKKWSNRKFVVNSLRDLPNDPLGFNEDFLDINFDECTLLLAYDIHNYPIDSYRTRYYLDNTEDTYCWMVIVGTNDMPNQWGEEWYFTRYALLVKKLPADAHVKFGLASTAINWDWE